MLHDCTYSAFLNIKDHSNADSENKIWSAGKVNCLKKKKKNYNEVSLKLNGWIENRIYCLN